MRRNTSNKAPGDGAGGLPLKFDVAQALRLMSSMAQAMTATPDPMTTGDDELVPWLELNGAAFAQLVRAMLPQAEAAHRIADEAARGVARIKVTHRNSGGTKSCVVAVGERDKAEVRPADPMLDQQHPPAAVWTEQPLSQLAAISYLLWREQLDGVRRAVRDRFDLMEQLPQPSASTAPTTDLPALLTLKQTAKVVGLAANTVEAMERKGDFPPRRTLPAVRSTGAGKRVFIKREVAAWIDGTDWRALVRERKEAGNG